MADSDLPALQGNNNYNTVDDYEGVDISKITIPNITPLKGDYNLEAWKRSIRSNFYFLGLTKFIDGTVVEPSADTDIKTKNRYRVQKATAYGWVEDDNEIDLHKLYKAACNAVGGMSDEAWTLLAKEFFHIDAAKYNNLRTWITRWHYIVAKLKDVGILISDKLLQANILTSLENYDNYWVDMLRFNV
ncbi:hypothetical protein C7999DRAFT_36283 [Corynascus novoguineensis]|uniref:Uncharacterized protein n=1 Tax=Corynascus novoguineensis TaxID=1126955 RepID=A0AAN7HFI8_9PEZI|nr:hypothetical protein C7999DRAFT_36283 [Corynascus novoguineensis]